jgi:iron complex outermembrane receptor protein
MKKHKLLAQCCVSQIALAVALGAGPALAQQTAAEGAAAGKGGLEEVIVTARKVAEKLQDVPVAVTAFNSEALKEQNAIRLSDMSGITPGLVVRGQQGAGASLAFFSLRGQFQSSELATVDPSVAVYVDGIYYARAFGINSDLTDVSSVQTLKGPQGTLFGRNTTGGAVLINTNDPTFDGFNGHITGTFGRFNYKSAEVVVNAPIVQDKVAARIAYHIVDSDGFDYNPVTNRQTGNHRNYEFRAKLLTKVNDNLSVLLSANVFRERDYPTPFQMTYVPPVAGVAALLSIGAETTGGACFTAAGGCAPVGQAAVNAYVAQYGGTQRVVPQNEDLESQVKTQTYQGTISYDTSFGTIKLIGGYRIVNPGNSVGDYDGSSYDNAAINNINNLRQWSGEGQITGKAFNDRLQYAGGVFYFHEWGLNSTTFLTFPPLVPPDFKVYYSGRISNSSVGVYGQGTYHLTDKLSLTGGLRWSRDHKAVTISNGDYFGSLSGLDPATFICSVGAGCPTYRAGNFSGVDYTAILDYKFTDDMMGYVKTAKAFRGGGVNLRETVLVPGASGVPFKPEKVTSYETGLKSEFWDKRVRLNIAEYYTISKNIQRTSIVSFAGPPPVSTTQVGNAGRADIWGGEYELTAKVYDTQTDGLTLGVSAANINPKYVDYHDPTTGFDKSHEPFDSIPKWQYTLSGTFTHDFEASTLSLHADWVWEGAYQETNDGFYVDSAGVYHNATDGSVESSAEAIGIHNALRKPASGVLNARAAIDFGKENQYELAVYGRNLLNNRDFIVAAPVPAFGLSAQRREPVTYGVQATVKF